MANPLPITETRRAFLLSGAGARTTYGAVTLEVQGDEFVLSAPGKAPHRLAIEHTSAARLDSHWQAYCAAHAGESVQAPAAPHSLSVRHVDTCLPCYVQDHCNGENEMLIGVPVDKASRMHTVRRDLAAEVRAYGDKLPAEFTDSDVESAIGDMFKGVHPLKAFDSSLDRASADDMGESCYAWFRFTWEGESN